VKSRSIESPLRSGQFGKFESGLDGWHASCCEQSPWQRQIIPLVDGMYLNVVDIEAQGDAWFLDYDRSAFREVSRESNIGEKGDALEFDFVVYERE
jgi:hypothetical protein